jgi:hypothetical protein
MQIMTSHGHMTINDYMKLGTDDASYTGPYDMSVI